MKSLNKLLKKLDDISILDHDSEGDVTLQKCPQCGSFLWERYIGTSPDDYESEYYCIEDGYTERI